MVAVRRHLFAYLLLTVAFLLAASALLHSTQTHRQKSASIVGWCFDAYYGDTGATVCLP